MLFKWQSFAGFVASSELSLVATSDLSQKFFSPCFPGFQVIAPTLLKPEQYHILNMKLHSLFLFDMTNPVLFEDSAHVHSTLLCLMFVSQLHDMFLLRVLFFGPSPTL